MSDQMPQYSPYTYTFNNPMRFNDPTGMVPEDGDPPGDPPSTVDGWIGEFSQDGLQHTWTKGKRQIVQQYNQESGLWNQSERNLDQTGTGHGLSAPNAQKGLDGFADDVSSIAFEMISLALGVTPMGAAGFADDAMRVASSSAKVGRVFWSGGDEAMNAAAAFARSNGGTTLEMTRAGQNLTNLTRGLDWATKARPMWHRMSAAYAKGAEGTAHVFHNSRGVGLNSAWRTVEYPILRRNGVNIIYHTVP